MSFSGDGKVWMNGKIIDWKDATVHIASHVIHYGSGVFEGARCYKTPTGSAFFLGGKKTPAQLASTVEAPSDRLRRAGNRSPAQGTRVE